MIITQEMKKKIHCMVEDVEQRYCAELLKGTIKFSMTFKYFFLYLVMPSYFVLI